MATIFPSGLVAANSVEWLAGEYVLAPFDPAVIVGGAGTFASAGAGAETVDIGIGAGAPVTVVSAGTETSASDWVATINAALGTAVAEVGFTGTIRLRHSARVRVTGYGGTGGADAAFSVIGLPVVDRDTSAPVTSYRPEVGVSLNNLSRAIQVVAAAKKIAVALDLFPGGASVAFIQRIYLVPMWSWEGSSVPRGGPPYGSASAHQVQVGVTRLIAPAVLVTDPGYIYDDPASVFLRDLRADAPLLRLNSFLVTPSLPFDLAHPAYEFSIPAGATHLRIYSAMAGIGVTEDLGAPVPPVVRCAVYQGA